MATGRPPPIPGKLVVRGYPLGTKDEEIRSWFEPFGELEEVASPPDRITRLPRGYTFVRYKHPMDADAALKAMSDKDINGCKLRVEQSRYAKGDGGTKSTRGMRRPEEGGRGRWPERDYWESRRPRSRSPPGHRRDDYFYRDRYDEYYRDRLYDDYYRDYYRERYPPPPPRRDYYDRYDERYDRGPHPPSSRRYSEESYSSRDPYYDSYDDYYGYDRNAPVRRPPPATGTEDSTVFSQPSTSTEVRRPANNYADDRFENTAANRTQVSDMSGMCVASQQPVTYPMPTNYRL